MITKTAIASFDAPKNFWPSKYLGEVPMISQFQKEKLTALIYQNIIEENDREIRLMELENLTETEANDLLYKFSTCKWA
jgi:hypothetical protein